MATIKKFIATSNGNRVFVSDLAAMADTIFGMMGAWPCPIPYCILKGVIGPQNTSLRINKGGGVLMYGKFFPTPNGDTLSIPKGSYLYAKAQNDTAEPRTSSTGQSYYQNIVYSLMVTTAKQTGTSTDYEAATGLWEIVDGAVTGAMETMAWIAYVKSISTLWRWDYIDNNLPANIVQTQAVADSAITTPKMAPGSVTSAILAPGSVTPEKLPTGSFPGVFNATTVTTDVAAITVYPWDYLVCLRGSATALTINLTDSTGIAVGTMVKMRISNANTSSIQATIKQPNGSSGLILPIPAGEVYMIEGIYVDGSYVLSSYGKAGVST